MATTNKSLEGDDSPLPPGFESAKDPATGDIYYINHNDGTNSWTHPHLKEEMPPGFECRINPSGKIYFVDHNTKTASHSHPRHADFHLPSSYPELPYPYEECLDGEGQHFYRNHANKTTSWLHPLKLAEIKATGILERKTGEFEEDGQAWKAWILEERRECGLEKGDTYFVNYRTGDLNTQSPETMRIAAQSSRERRAMRELESASKDQPKESK